MTRAGSGRRASILATSLALIAAWSCAGRPPAPDSPALVLTEVHSGVGAAPETLVTWIADGRVRVAHRGGVAILDATADRFLLLDPATRTVRSMGLAAWESKLRDAVSPGAGTGAAPRALRFEPEGAAGVVAGYACERYHIFTDRQLFPGEWEEVEQEIWVSRDLPVSKAAFATYRRVLASLDWIGLDAAVERPEGIPLRTEVRRRARGSAPGGEDLETSEVVRVETQTPTRETFSVPPGYRPASEQDPPAAPDSVPGPRGSQR